MCDSIALRHLSMLLLPFMSTPDAQAQAPPAIENSRRVWKPAEVLRLAPTPALVIGIQGGPMYEFDRVAGSARLHDGRIVVADGGSSSLRFFDSTGIFLKSVGGRGAGPGEFQSLGFFSVMQGDTLVAGAITGELSYFTGTGQYLQRRGSMNPPLQIAKAGMPIAPASLDGSGTRAVGAISRPSPRGGASRWVDSFPVAIVDASNTEVRRLGTLPSMELAMSSNGPRQTWFGANATFASDGKLFDIGFGSEYAIRAYTPAGNLIRIIRRRPIGVNRASLCMFAEPSSEWVDGFATPSFTCYGSVNNLRIIYT
jgi:6-bladed beta-propeller